MATTSVGDKLATSLLRLGRFEQFYRSGRGQSQKSTQRSNSGKWWDENINERAKRQWQKVLNHAQELEADIQELSAHKIKLKAKICRLEEQIDRNRESLKEMRPEVLSLKAEIRELKNQKSVLKQKIADMSGRMVYQRPHRRYRHRQWKIMDTIRYLWPVILVIKSLAMIYLGKWQTKIGGILLLVTAFMQKK